MNSRSKIALVSMLINGLWFILLYFTRLPQTGLAQAELSAYNRQWGVFFVLLVGGQAALDMLVVIVFTLMEKKKGGKGFDEVTDERDRHIEKRAVYRLGITLSLGLLTGLLLLAAGQGLQLFFTALAFTSLLSGMVFWGSFILGYERGL